MELLCRAKAAGPRASGRRGGVLGLDPVSCAVQPHSVFGRMLWRGPSCRVCVFESWRVAAHLSHFSHRCTTAAPNGARGRAVRNGSGAPSQPVELDVVAKRDAHVRHQRDLDRCGRARAAGAPVYMIDGLPTTQERTSLGAASADANQCVASGQRHTPWNAAEEAKASAARRKHALEACARSSAADCEAQRRRRCCEGVGCHVVWSAAGHLATTRGHVDRRTRRLG